MLLAFMTSEPGSPNSLRLRGSSPDATGPGPHLALIGVGLTVASVGWILALVGF